MDSKKCVGADCYSSGACRPVIDTYQGVSGPAFRAASGLQSCALTFDCTLPCPGSVPDAGASPDSGGRLCAPGREVACGCDGGSDGTKKCDVSGDEFGSCICGAEAGTAAEKRDDGSCGCRLGGPSRAGGTALFAAALALFFAARQTSRRRMWS
jgi:MYXO-CTERM domain-containing protein